MAVTNLADELIYIGLLIVAYLGFSPVAGRRLDIYFLLAIYSNGLLKQLFATVRPFKIDPAVLPYVYRPQSTLPAVPASRVVTRRVQRLSGEWPPATREGRGSP